MKRFAPVAAWVVALACLIGAAQELSRQRQAADLGTALGALPQLTVKTVPLGLADYQAIQKKTPVFGSISISPTPQGLSVRAGALADYAAWRLTIDQILLENTGVNWRIDTLCSGKCSTEDAHKAVLTGVRRLGVLEPKSGQEVSMP